MTATYRLKGLGWLAVCVIVALAFYLVSLQVSVERKKLESVDSQIARAQDDIRSLQTEFATRANLAQLERWNGDVLALTAPTPAQYVPNEQALASLDFNAPGGAQVQMASLVIPTLPTDAAQPDATSGPAEPKPSQPAARAVRSSRQVSTVSSRGAPSTSRWAAARECERPMRAPCWSEVMKPPSTNSTVPRKSPSRVPAHSPSATADQRVPMGTVTCG